MKEKYENTWKGLAEFYYDSICELESDFNSGDFDNADFWYVRNGRNFMNDKVIDIDAVYSSEGNRE